MAETRIRFRDDGPCLIEGPLALYDGQGNPLPAPPSDKGNIALCRCGASSNKPFCDGAHRQSGFRSSIRSPQAGD